MDILLHVGEYGWEKSAWSDNTLSTKKLYPNHQYAAKAKVWLPRLRTTVRSMALTVQRVHAEHRKTPTWMKKKIDAARVEQLSERAAVIVALEAELMQRMPLDVAKVQAEWSNAWAEGSDHVDIEVQSLVLEKDEKLDVTLNITIFRKLIDDHLHNQPVRGGDAGENAEHLDSEIDVDRFELTMKQVKYDQVVFANWMKKMASAITAFPL